MENSCKTRLALGRIVATPGVLDELERTGDMPDAFLIRHANGDWSEMSEIDRERNALAVENGSRVFSAYRLRDDTKIWIITEADRSVTTLLLPDDY